MNILYRRNNNKNPQIYQASQNNAVTIMYLSLKRVEHLNDKIWKRQSIKKELKRNAKEKNIHSKPFRLRPHTEYNKDVISINTNANESEVHSHFLNEENLYQFNKIFSHFEHEYMVRLTSIRFMFDPLTENVVHIHYKCIEESK